MRLPGIAGAIAGAAATVVGGGAGHRYWRVVCTARAGGSVYVIGELEWIATAGGSDVTALLSGTDSRAIASSYYTSLNLPQWQAYNSNLNSVWANDPSDPTNPWIGWDFGTNQEIYSVKIESGTTSSFQQPSSGHVDYSDDGSTWTTAASFTHGWGDNQTLEVLVNPAATSYANSGGTGNRTGSITVSATNITAGGGTLSDLVDGSQSNSYWWNSATGNGTAWLTFDFGSSKIIDAFKWYQDNTTAHGVWRLDGSPDNSTWTQVDLDFTLAGATGGTEYVIQNVTAYRYYRLRHMSGTRSTNPYLREIEFRIL